MSFSPASSSSLLVRVALPRPSQRAFSSSSRSYALPPDPHQPFPKMSRPRRAGAMDRMNPIDQAELGGAAAPGPMRPFNKGDIMAPNHLHKQHLAPIVRGKPLRKVNVAPEARFLKPIDPFHNLNINPSNEYLNGRLLSSFVTSVGRIKTRAENGLTEKSQKRVSKAIKRARCMGLISRWSNVDPLGEKRVVGREGQGFNRDWSIVEGEGEFEIAKRQ